MTARDEIFGETVSGSAELFALASKSKVWTRIFRAFFAEQNPICWDQFVCMSVCLSVRTTFVHLASVKLGECNTLSPPPPPAKTYNSKKPLRQGLGTVQLFMTFRIQSLLIFWRAHSDSWRFQPQQPVKVKKALHHTSTRPMFKGFCKYFEMLNRTPKFHSSKIYSSKLFNKSQLFCKNLCSCSQIF